MLYSPNVTVFQQHDVGSTARGAGTALYTSNGCSQRVQPVQVQDLHRLNRSCTLNDCSTAAERLSELGVAHDGVTGRSPRVQIKLLLQNCYRSSRPAL